MSSFQNNQISWEFNNSLKKYSSKRAVLKNNIPIKYLLTDHNLFIHVTYWVFFVWFLTIIFSILIPVHNTYFFGRGVKIVFETAFNFIAQSLYKHTQEGLGILSTSVWTLESRIFLVVSMSLVGLSWYCIFCVQQFLWEFLNIVSKYDDRSKRLISRFKKFIKIFFIFAVFNMLLTTFSLLYIRIGGGRRVKTLLFQTFQLNSHQSKSGSSGGAVLSRNHYIYLSISGFIILFNNIGIFLVSTFLYGRYSSSLLRNNRFFFKFVENLFKTESVQEELTPHFKLKASLEKTINAIGDYKRSNTKGYIAELSGVNKYFQVDNKQFHALKDINLKIKKGEFIVILGPSGSGKTTLLNILAGIDKPTNGDITIGDCNTKKMSSEQLNIFRRKKVGYIFQHYSLLPTLTAKENILMAQYLIKEKKKKKIDVKSSVNQLSDSLSETRNILRKLQIIKNFILGLFFVKEDEREINYLLDVLNLKAHVNKYPHQLSGGQQQRVAIARAFIKHPEILFGDEPTGAIDHAMSKSILELFYLINKYSKTTVILITHNPLIAQMAKRVLYISEGRIFKDVINLKPKLVHEIKGL